MGYECFREGGNAPKEFEETRCTLLEQQGLSFSRHNYLIIDNGKTEVYDQHVIL